MANNNPLQGQPKQRRVDSYQPQGSIPLSASPSQLSISSGGILPNTSYASNPYNSSPYQNFQFPQGQLSHQSPFQHHSITPVHHQQGQQIPPSPSSLSNARKRRASEIDSGGLPGQSHLGGVSFDQHNLFGSDHLKHEHSPYGMPGPSSMVAPGSEVLGQNPDSGTPRPVKKGRTNTPWTPAEEQRLKVMRDAGNSWSEIAKTFPTRTEGSVKKHWYKDMHYADFAEDESTALLAAIKEYEASKWKVIGQKVGKPAKACEQYAKEHLGMKS